MSFTEPAEPAAPAFTVLLSVGLPPRAPDESLSDFGAEAPTDADTIGDLQWYLAITSVVRATFRRRGTVLVPYDRDLLPLLWALALEHAHPPSAEPGTPADPPLEVAITEEVRFGLERDVGSDQVPPRVYEATGALRFVPGTMNGPNQRILPEPHLLTRTPIFAVEIWPSSDTAADAPMLQTASERLVISPGQWTPYATQPIDEPVRPDDDQIDLFSIEKTLDRWLGIDEGSNGT
jgi:hypothetical protein